MKAAAAFARAQWQNLGRQDGRRGGVFSDNADLLAGLPAACVALIREWWCDGYDVGALESCDVIGWCDGHATEHVHACPEDEPCQRCERDARDMYLEGVAHAR